MNRRQLTQRAIEQSLARPTTKDGKPATHHRPIIVNQKPVNKNQMFDHLFAAHLGCNDYSFPE